MSPQAERTKKPNEQEKIRQGSNYRRQTTGRVANYPSRKTESA
jgi:hypothetical protein